jgi:hypothetical protein
MDLLLPSACDCPVDRCRSGVQQAGCVNFYARTATLDVDWCERCGQQTWHKDRECLKIPVAESE